MRTATLLLAAGIGAAAAPAPVAALDAASRAVLGGEIRQVLSNDPGLVAPVLAAPPSPAAPYRDHVARDLATIAGLSDRLFAPDRPGFGPRGAPVVIALFTRAGCAACARAEAELRRLAEATGLRANVFDIDAAGDMAARLGLDTAPSYVMADRMLRGHMPAVVLERYLREVRDR